MARKTSTPTVPVKRSVNDLISLRGMAEMAGVTPEQVLQAVAAGTAQGTLSPFDGAYYFTPMQRLSVLAEFPAP